MRKKYFKKWVMVFVVILIIMAVIWAIISALDFSQGKPVKFGVTFSHKFASQNLGLDWTEVYWAVINDLGVKDIRLAMPWDALEEQNGFYNIMAIGRRTPRWPECHDPRWLANLSKQKTDQEILELLEQTVNHFKKYENISVWQVENEPLLDLFGECPKADKALLKQEVALVRSLDQRPIMITDTGELSSWTEAAGLADILGITMYKTVWNKFIGVWRYPWPPAYYHFKAKRIERQYQLDKIIVSELQAEPWASGEESLAFMPVADQLNLFSRNDFGKNLEYVKRAGFDEAYLWGVEWWYWLKKEQNMPQFWNEAKLIWQK